MQTEYEAVQERRTTYLGCPCYKRIAKTFPEFCQAEAYARRILGQRPGVPVDIFERFEVQRGRYRGTDSTRVAVVSRDALGRTWTDSMTWEGLI